MKRHHLLIIALLFPILASCSTPGMDGDEQYTVDFYTNNAQHYYEGEHYDRALQQFEKALELDDDDGRALLGRAWCLLLLAEGDIMRGDAVGAELLSEASDAFADLNQRGLGDSQYKIDLGTAKIRALYGDLYSERVKNLKEELKYRPAGDPMHLALSDAERSASESYFEADALFKKVLSSEEPGAQDNLTALLQLARLAVIRSEFAEALVYAEQYREQVRRSKDLWVRSLKQFPEDKPIWEAKLAGAVTKEVEVLDLIANAYFKLGQYQLAKEELDRLLLLDPYRTDAYLNRGILNQKIDKLRPALEDFNKFMSRAADLDMSPEDPRVIEATKRIMAIESALGMESSVPAAQE